MTIAKHKQLAVRRLPSFGLVIATVLTSFAPNKANAQAPVFPTTTQPAAPATAESKVEAYPLNTATRDVLTVWQLKSSGRSDIRVALDERTSQALVFAPPAVHAEIQKQLSANRAVAPPVAAPAAPAAPMASQFAPLAQSNQPTQAPTVGLAVPGNAVLFQLRQMPGAEVHSKLENLLSRQLPATVDASGEWQSFPVEATPGARVVMSVNIRANQLRLDGPPAQVAAWRSVIEALDSPPVSADKVTKLVSTKPTSHDRVRKALQVLQADSDARPAGSASLISTIFQPQTIAAADTTTQLAAGQPASAPPVPGGQPAVAAPPATTQALPGAAQTAMDAAKLAEAAGGLLGPVQVEFVEGLDVIVLRGSERDVQRVMEIIKQIEDLSAVTVPDIQIYELKYVDSVQMGALLERLYAQVLGPRIGTVSITPLGKPNALLLIGRPENVKMAIELIGRLDQPVVPTARFEVFPLKHASASEAKTLIDSFLGQGAGQGEGQPVSTTTTGTGGGGGGTNNANQVPTLAPRALVVADPRTNSLIVSAGQRDIAEIAALVSRIDTPGAAAELKVFTIANGDATALRDMLSSLFSVPADSGGGGGGGDNQQAAGGALGQGGPVRMQFSVDTRTNSIIAVGSREDLSVVEAILLRLDEGDLRERTTTVYRLNNAFAQNVATALNQWLQTERQNEQNTEITISPFQEIERQVVIEPEGATNSLIVSATPRYYNEVIKVIKELDERPPMVLIQVMIAEVKLNDTDEFGLEIGLQDSLLFDRSLVSDVQTLTTTTTNQVNGTAVTVEQQNIINAAGQPGFNFNNQPLGNNLSTAALAGASTVASQGLSNFSLGRVNNDLGFGGFVFSASSNAVNVLLRALQEKRRLEVLSRPQLMALDGQPGYVQVGQNVPRIVATNIDALGGQTNSITYEAVGLILQVVPRISPDGLVVMQITANKSEVGPESDGIPISVSNNGQVLRAPRIDITQALTTVSALGGQTVVLGGLLQTRKLDIHRQVPILGDIPLLGDLFRYDSVSEERRELLIILTPQIIYNKMDSDLVKQIESSRMSYILSDVINLHGEAGLRCRCDEWYDGETESVFPNVMPEEGMLPLSRGAMSANGEMQYCAPGGEIIAPELQPALPIQPGNGESLPTPALPTTPTQPIPPQSRQSPSTSRPINPRLTSTPNTNAVIPASYEQPVYPVTR